MIAHTPGPWDARRIAHYWSIGGPTDCIASTNRCYAPEEEANARLIAVAPDLLSLVRRFIALPSGAWHPERHAAEEMELAREATALLAALDGEV